MSNKKAFLISDIEDYGKLISFCIQNDISVFRTYWDDRERGYRCYNIDWLQKRCFYSSRQYYEDNGYLILVPHFVLDDFGYYKIV